MEPVQIVQEYGFPILSCGAMGYLIYYVWKWTTQEVKPLVSEISATVIALIDRIRMLDNDLIRLNQKLNTYLQFRDKSKGR